MNIFLTFLIFLIFSSGCHKFTPKENQEDYPLPVISIGTNGQEITDRQKTKGTMIYRNPGLSFSFKEDIKIKVRGNSSRGWAKKNYTVTIKDDAGVSFGKLPSHRKWVFHGPYSDKTLMRNYLAFTLAREISKEWVPHVFFVEVYINHDYKGVYLIEEKIEIAPHRVAINPLSSNPEDTGYILKLDARDDDESFVKSKDVGEVIIAYPKRDDLTEAHISFVKKQVDELSDALDDYKNNHQSCEKIKEILDLDIAVNQFIIQQVSMDPDSFWKSQYFYKDKNKPFKIGPPWDFNLGFGNYTYKSTFDNTLRGEDDGVGLWFTILDQGSCYRDALTKRYNELRTQVLSEESVERIINRARELLRKPQERNFVRWPVLSEMLPFNREARGSFDAEVDFLLEWMLKRLVFLDATMDLDAQESEMILTK